MSLAISHHEFGMPAGPSVLLIGALGSDHTMWEPQVAALANRYRIIAVDLRGHGESPSPAGPYSVANLSGDVIMILDTLGITSTHIVGASLGSIVGQWISAHHPRRVVTLTLIATEADAGHRQRWDDEACHVRTNGMAAHAPAVVDRWFTATVLAHDADLVARQHRIVQAMTAEGYAACCDALATWGGGSHERARIVAPTLLIECRRDPANINTALSSWATEIANCKTHVVGPCGELGTVELAGTVTQSLKAHLAEHTRATREAGMKVRRSVLGDDHVESSIAGTTDFTAPFQDFITRTAWGDIWARPDLDHHTRRLLTLAILTAVGNEHELDMHIRAALRAGTDPADLTEVFLHTAVYAGVPNSNLAFALGKKAIAELRADTSRQADMNTPSF